MYYDPDNSWTSSPRTTNASPRLNFAIDSSVAAAGLIADIIVTDVWNIDLVASLGGLAGSRVTLDLPLIGRREVVIRWIAGNRAGCRLITPLNDDGLRDAICESADIAEYFPGFLGKLSPALSHHDEPWARNTL